MSAPTKLFLEKNPIDDKFHVNDADGFAFGGPAEYPDEAIKHARVVTDAPIHFGSGVSVVNPEETIDYDNYEVLISDLCFALKKRVVHIYDENLNFKGWKMEARE